MFARHDKTMLYTKGKPFCDYNAHPPNFRCKFNDSWFVDKAEYLRKKQEHLAEQCKVQLKQSRFGRHRDILAYWLHTAFKVPAKDIAARLSLGEREGYTMVMQGKDYTDMRTDPDK